MINSLEAMLKMAYGSRASGGFEFTIFASYSGPTLIVRDERRKIEAVELAPRPGAVEAWAADVMREVGFYVRMVNAWEGRRPIVWS